MPQPFVFAEYWAYFVALLLLPMVSNIPLLSEGIPRAALLAGAAAGAALLVQRRKLHKSNLIVARDGVSALMAGISIVMVVAAVYVARFSTPLTASDDPLPMATSIMYILGAHVVAYLAAAARLRRYQAKRSASR